MPDGTADQGEQDAEAVINSSADRSSPFWHLHKWRRGSQVRLLLILLVLTALIMALTMGKKEVCGGLDACACVELRVCAVASPILQLRSTCP